MHQVRRSEHALGYARYRQDSGTRLEEFPAVDAPTPLEIFTRLGVMLMIALAFGLAAELLVRLPPH